MALKYFFEFTDVESILHRCEIYNEDFVGDATEINGNCVLTKASTNDTLESIRGGGLQINLEASIDLDFTDLYSEEERTFLVKYYRDGQIKFNGYLSPEGLFQSFSDEIWNISLDCIDGLGFLQNLSYVDNVTKEQFVGKQSMIEVISNCLKRTGIEQDIYVNIDIFYEGTTLYDGGVLANTFINSFRYIKEDNQTTMQCDEVLRTILEPFAACITQYNGSWFIYKPNTMHSYETLYFYKFDKDGVYIDDNVPYNFRKTLGSQINGFYPHHANSNQQISIDNSIGAYRISYKYGLTNAFFDNLLLENVAGVIDEWTIDDATYLDFPTDDRGFIVTGRPNLSISKILTSQTVSLLEGNTISYQETLRRITESNLKTGTSRTLIKLVGGSGTRYLYPDGSWQSSQRFLGVFLQFNEEYNYRIDSAPLPFDGDVFIEIWTPSNSSNITPDRDVEYLITRSFIAPSNDLGLIKGEIHTFQRISKPSSKIGETKEVFNGDSPSELYVGTIYKADEVTPTSLWNFSSTGELINYATILQIMGLERMKMYAKPLKVFKGDVYGFIDFLSVVTIDNIDGLFVPIEYKYNASDNITTLKMKEILNYGLPNSTFSDIEYNLQINNENQVVEPTIKG